MSKELLFSLTKKDFRVDTFRGSGAGGQKRNKTSSGIRITHIETGISAECEEHREQSRNKSEAFKKLTNSTEFRAWLNRKIFEKTHDLQEIKDQVDSMVENETRLEVQKDGKWILVDREFLNQEDL